MHSTCHPGSKHYNEPNQKGEQKRTDSDINSLLLRGANVNTPFHSLSPQLQIPYGRDAYPGVSILLGGMGTK